MKLGLGLGLSNISSAATAQFESSLVLTEWVQAPFSAAPWAGSASAGISGSESMNAGIAPAVGATLNGFATASFVSGLTKYLETTNNAGSYITAAAGSMWALVKPTTVPSDAAAGFPFLEAAVLLNSGGNFGLFLATSGSRAGINSGGWKATPYTAAATGSWSLLQMRWNSTILEHRVNSVAWTSVACGAIGTITSKIQLARNGSGGTFLNGLVASMGCTQSRLSDSDFDGIKTSINTRFALSL